MIHGLIYSNLATLRSLLPRYTTSASRFLVVDDLMVHYRDEGCGPVLLLLHGAFSSLHTYNAWTLHFKKHFRVVRLDLMGFGLTGPNSSEDYTMDNYVRLIHQFLNILRIEHCHIAGSSLGGWIAWEFATRYPKRVDRLMLINSAGFLEDDAIPLPFRLAQAPLAPRLLRYVIRRSILELFVKQVFYDESKATENVIDRYYNLFTRDGNLDALLAIVTSPFEDRSYLLETVKHPTLILWGAEDAWIPVEHAYRFQRTLPNATLKVYPQVGHIPMEEIPEISAKDVLRFLGVEVS